MKELCKEQYFEIYNKHKDDLCIHSSYTDVDGHGFEWSNGNPQWMTEWGLKGSDKPMIRAESETIDGVTTHLYYKFNPNKD